MTQLYPEELKMMIRVTAFSICIVSTLLCESLIAEDRIEVRLIDPRIVTHTTDTIGIGYSNAKTDVIALRRLTQSESSKLRPLLKAELSSSRDVPFCGHSPAYAITITTAKGKASTVTLCGLCGTWARDGDLRVLKGKLALEYLRELLPLPDVFSSVNRLPDLMRIDRSVAFHLLPPQPSSDE